MSADSGSLAAVVRDGRPGPRDRGGRLQARVRALPEGPDHRPRGGADLLRAAVAVPGAAVRRRAARLLRPAGPDRRRGARSCVSVGAPSETVDAVTSALEGAQENRGTALTALVLGAGDVAVRRLGRVRRGRARAQRDLAGRGGPRLRQAQGPRHRLDARGARARARDVRARVPRRRAVGVRLRPDRARRDHRRGLALRALAGGAAGDDPDLRGRLLRGAQRGDPPLPVDHPGRGVRRRSRGCSPRSRSSSTSRTSAPTRPPTARSRRR